MPKIETDRQDPLGDKREEEEKEEKEKEKEEKEEEMPLQECFSHDS